MKTSTIFCLTLCCTLMTMFSMMSEISPMKKDKKLPFECGFENLSEKKTTFSTNFIMLMLMFLIFDVEIAILIPFLTMNKNNQTKMMLLSSLFISILMALTLKEWKQGSLEWTK